MATALVRQPMYQQLNEALRGLVSSGEFKTGARFLSEREVSSRFEVSRITANKALSNLVSEGILEFRKGVGTFVRGGVLDYDLRSRSTPSRRRASPPGSPPRFASRAGIGSTPWSGSGSPTERR